MYMLETRKIQESKLVVALPPLLIEKNSNVDSRNLLILTYIHTYHPRFIPVGVAEASQIFLRDAHVLLKLFNYK
jgi:hypothetical protein